MVDLLVLILIGLTAGVVAGLLGIGGGVIFTPVLFFIFDGAGIENPVVWTIGSGLFCTFVTAFGSTVRQAVQENMFWREGIQLGIMGAVGVYLGKLVVVSSYYREMEFVIFFSLMLLYASFMMFRRGQDKSKESERASGNLYFKGTFVTGGVGGFVAALAGVGGGTVMVPIMNLLFKLPFRKTVSVSQLAMTIMIFTGWAQLAFFEENIQGLSNYTLGFVDFGTALPLSIGGILGGYAGALWNHKINRRILQWGFAILALVMAGRLIWGIL